MSIVVYPATTVINQYLFEHADMIALLGNTDFLDAPVFPVGEQPESVSPYILYNYRTRTRSQQWWMMYDDITYAIFSTDLGELMNIERTIVDILKRYELSAKEINDWAKANGHSTTHIKSVMHGGSMHFSPQRQEGGVFLKQLFFEVYYTQSVGTGVT